MSNTLSIDYRNPGEARSYICPFRDKSNCEGNRCMKWRWETVQIYTEPGGGGGSSFPQLPKIKRTERGYCDA